MAHEIFMPKLSSTMSEGSITEWYKEEGDPVEMGESIFEVMTDKIAIEVEAYHSGILLKKYYGVDEPVPVNHVIGYIGEPGEKVPESPPGEPTRESGAPADEYPAQQTPTANTEGTTAAEKAEVPSRSQEENLGRSKSVNGDRPEKREPELQKSGNGKIRATPSARRMARESALDLFAVLGTGRNGRIQMEDVKRHLAEQPAKAAAEPAPVLQPQKSVELEKASWAERETIIPWKGMRQVISKRMTQSKQEVPHVTLHASFNAARMIALRQELLPLVEAGFQKRISYTEIIMKAMAVALKQHPRLNAHALEDGIHEYKDVNIGLAVALEDGLVVPVLRQVNQKGLGELTQEAKTLAEKAKKNQLTQDEMSGGTITITNLGNSRVESFNPIINQPEVAILGVDTLKEEVDLDEAGNWYKKPVMTLSLSFDHRAVDGAPAAKFLDTLIGILENPTLLLL